MPLLPSSRGSGYAEIITGGNVRPLGDIWKKQQEYAIGEHNLAVGQTNLAITQLGLQEKIKQIQKDQEWIPISSVLGEMGLNEDTETYNLLKNTLEQYPGVKNGAIQRGDTDNITKWLDLQGKVKEKLQDTVLADANISIAKSTNEIQNLMKKKTSIEGEFNQLSSIPVEQQTPAQTMQLQEKKANIAKMEAEVERRRQQLQEKINSRQAIYQSKFPKETYETTIGKAEEPYTLSPGQVRFRGTEAIAGVSPEEKTPTSLEQILAERVSKGELTLEQALELKQQQQAEKEGKTWVLPDGETVTSFDGGRTYEAQDGKSYPMPYGSVKYQTTADIEDVKMMREQQKLKKGQPSQQDITQLQKTKTGFDAALGGTGVYSKVQAMLNGVFGGLGLDALVGANGIFPDNEKNRQTLKLIRQSGIVAFMNSARGAIYEQKIIYGLFPEPEKFFRNPRTEAAKFQVIRDMMLEEQGYNIEILKNPNTPKTEFQKLMRSNQEMNRLLAIIGDLPPTTPTEIPYGLNPEDNALIDKYLRKQ